MKRGRRQFSNPIFIDPQTEFPRIFELLEDRDRMKWVVENLEKFDQVIGYENPTGPVTTADEYYDELEKALFYQPVYWRDLQAIQNSGSPS